MRTIKQMWDDGRRAYVVECLARNKFPFKGWDKKYPDLAAERMQKVRASCQRCGATLTSADREGDRCTQCHEPLHEAGRGEL